jgi:hypothetical protein
MASWGFLIDTAFIEKLSELKKFCGNIKAEPDKRKYNLTINRQ